MKANLSFKRLVTMVSKERPEDLSRRVESEQRNFDTVAYMKLSLADDQALQLKAEDTAKLLWEKLEGLSSDTRRTIKLTRVVNSKPSS
ncbi:hypothetical protein TNCV_886121 [Trichonephila clavipes]|nr:hypothetical protein TNCV_886121 [Trichonephila clavipes]